MTKKIADVMGALNPERQKNIAERAFALASKERNKAALAESNTTSYGAGVARRKGEKVKAKEIAMTDKPLSELYRLAALEWGDKYSAWYTYSENKTTTLAVLKSIYIKDDPKLSEAKAERLAKNTPEWKDYMEIMCTLHKEALRLRAYKESIDMRYHELQSKQASARSERKLY